MPSSSTKIVVLVSGSGSNLQAIIDNIKSGNIDGEIVAVISNVANVKGLQRAIPGRKVDPQTAEEAAAEAKSESGSKFADSGSKSEPTEAESKNDSESSELQTKE